MSTSHLRTQLRSSRRALDGSARHAASTSMCSLLLDLPELRGPGRLASYMATDGELDPAAAAAPLRRRGWSMHLPVLGHGRSMRFAPWTDRAPMGTNRYGIAEPEAAEGSLVDADDLDVVLVPCVAVDLSGNRLGFGAGFYDRALARSGPLLVAVAYEEAVLDGLDHKEWDVPMHVVVTEAAVRRPGSRPDTVA